MKRGAVSRAIESLRKGGLILVHDSTGRENEIDMVIASEFVNPSVIRTMRRDGGGLICTTVHPEVRRRLDLPYMDELLLQVRKKYPVTSGLIAKDIPYDRRSAFSLTINHKDTFTGITDRDRSLTISRFAELAQKSLRSADGVAQEMFAKEFRSPGHVHLLNASDSLLKSRKGHTELSTALMEMAGLTPSATICEMMGDDGYALSVEEAKRYAFERGLVFLEGEEIEEAWISWSE